MKALDLKNIFHNNLDIVYGKNEVSSFFYLCLEHYLDVSKIQLALNPEFSIPKNELTSFFNTLEELKAQRPIQYIFGETQFFGLKFKVNKHVLIPRQETEELINLILKQQKSNVSIKAHKPIKILDIGTGSGCIAITLAKNMPNAEVYALDISDKALEVAKQNAELNNVNITFINEDILKANTLEFADFKFNVIVSNPPYVRNLEKEEILPNVLDNEPHLALFVDDDNPLVFYKAITQYAVSNLKKKGQLYFEINQYLGEQTKQILNNSGFSEIELIKDLNTNDRILKGTLL